MRRLSPSMSLEEFDNGYWYAADLKRFAKRLGIARAGALRKDELEPAIRTRLSGKTLTVSRRAAAQRVSSEPRDVDRGLRLELPVVRYTNEPRTKEFLEREAARLDKSYRRRSGARYRLNRWREEQLARGVKITYGDLVAAYVRLSRPDVTYARIASTRYLNFLTDFLNHEPHATRASALEAWHALKKMNCPKTYDAWRKARAARKNRPARPK